MTAVHWLIWATIGALAIPIIVQAIRNYFRNTRYTLEEYQRRQRRQDNDNDNDNDNNTKDK